jgi:hypothetical protein
VLAFAATASAEVRAGEATSPEDTAIPGKGDILAATARYDSSSGGVTFTVTTREAPVEKQELSMAGVLGRPTEGTCNLLQLQVPSLPLMEINAQGTPTGSPTLETPPTWIALGEDQKIDGLGLAERSVAETTTTLSASSSELADKPYSCATIVLQTVPPLPMKPGEEVEAPEILDEVNFLLSTLPEPPPAPKTPQPAAPAPAALSIAKAKPLKARTGKWTKVKIKVTNTGGTAVGPVAFKATAPAGVLVKPGSPKLPALLGGQTWTVALQVKLTEKAKSKSTITLTGTAGALSATGSVVVKPAG